MMIEQNNYYLVHVTLPETERLMLGKCKRSIVSSQLIVSGSELEFLAANRLSSPLLEKRSQILLSAPKYQCLKS